MAHGSADVVVLQSSDGIDFKVSKHIARLSQTIEHMLTDVPGQDAQPIMLPNVSSTVLQKVIEYCTHHAQDPAAVSGEQDDYSVDNIAGWDKLFIDVEMNLLFELILAANYLDIRGLADLGCKTVAKLVIGRTPEEIERTFQIPDHLAKPTTTI